jgi:hypothetical protein
VQPEQLALSHPGGDGQHVQGFQSGLDSGRVVASTLGWFAELDDLLIRDYSALPEVQDFHDRFTVLRRSSLGRQRSDRR